MSLKNPEDLVFAITLFVFNGDVCIVLGDVPVSAVNIKLIRLLGFEIWVGKHPKLVIFGKVKQKYVLFSRM